MPLFDNRNSGELSVGPRRRDFLHAGSLAAAGLGLTRFSPLHAMTPVNAATTDTSCIFLMLVGGPSQLDTWDPKPNAPREIRGPYKPIKTNVPGIEISEIFPRTAQLADKFAIIRSMTHSAEPVHATGLQMMQTGRLLEAGTEYPHIGFVAAKLKPSRAGVPSHVLLPGLIGKTGGNLPHGQTAGFLGSDFDPFLPAGMPRSTFLNRGREGAVAENPLFDLRREPPAVREKYGMNRFGQSCLLARRLVEAGVRFVTVNMFDTVFNEFTWDIHGAEPFSPIASYGDYVGPMFDRSYSSLLSELNERGLLRNTMVVATGEFGRTPKINPAGGRDHWPQCWSMLMAGGGICGGQIIGSSDSTGAAPKDRPTSPMEIAATIYKGLGIDLATKLQDAQGRPVPMAHPGTQPVHELFA